MNDRITLDHAATTVIRPEAAAAMAEGMARWANPSSQHAEGRAARAALEGARDRIKAALGWTGELLFTSGATEAAAIALGRAKRPVAISAVEHAAVVGAAPGAAVLPVGADGLVDAEMPEDALVAIQQVNSETGVIQPLDALAERIKTKGGLLFADCAQGAAKLPLPPADMIAVSAHKFGGPPGIGALLARDLGALTPVGQGQEQGYRPGTENLPGALGFAAALDAGEPWLDAVAAWREELDAAVRAAGGVVICDASPRLATIASYRMPGVSAAAQLMRFDLGGFAVSAGSACSSGSLKRSPVLAAIGLVPEAADQVIRVSLGWTTTAEDVRAFADAWAALAHEARARAA
ncbi:cysteine desulfurase [Sphingomonas vulcanisoli]|uniref:Cysteine desulfurase n=1 Tax=Sphingomonas vulcanisoli TaxID=1658060 RepID=A0ABX0TSD4_9SPHN|nr:aminotransferase class V-fold PLP-dependent enzyme [Sphingomonas vulcanisoli]NIJ08376.1 cysteine desulfurase [Sphingomonas vulcanisoli]